MKTFKDLEFKIHSAIADGTHAKMRFPDGSEISIINGSGAYAGTGSYEMMSNRTKSREGIRGWMTPEQITRHMKYIQRNPMMPF